MTNEYLKVRLKYKGKIKRVQSKLLENKINIEIEDNIWRASID